MTDRPRATPLTVRLDDNGVRAVEHDPDATGPLIHIKPFLTLLHRPFLSRPPAEASGAYESVDYSRITSKATGPSRSAVSSPSCTQSVPLSFQDRNGGPYYSPAMQEAQHDYDNRVAEDEL